MADCEHREETQIIAGENTGKTAWVCGLLIETPTGDPSCVDESLEGKLCPIPAFSRKEISVEELRARLGPIYAARRARLAPSNP